MVLGIRLHLAKLSLSNTILELESFGVKRPSKPVHDWVQKTDLQPASDASPNYIALDEIVMQVNGQRYWLYAAVDPVTNQFHHIRLFTTTTTASTQKFSREPRAKHDVSGAIFLVDHIHYLSATLNRVRLRFQTVRHGNLNAIEHIFQAIKRQIYPFLNIFSIVSALAGLIIATRTLSYYF